MSGWAGLIGMLLLIAAMNALMFFHLGGLIILVGIVVVFLLAVTGEFARRS
jgi:hypothetical protein